MSKPFVYVVTMYRWGDREQHSYVYGVYSTEEEAKDRAKRETTIRGGKYLPEVIEMQTDSGYRKHNRTVVELVRHWAFRNTEQS